MLCFGFELWTEGWYAQTDPLSCDGRIWPCQCYGVVSFSVSGTGGLR